MIPESHSGYPCILLNDVKSLFSTVSFLWKLTLCASLRVCAESDALTGIVYPDDGFGYWALKHMTLSDQYAKFMVK